MENKAHALTAGAFVLGLVAALAALVVWLTRDNTVRNTFDLSTHDAVSGLQPQAMVRYRGIAVGKVTSIDFDDQVKGNVRVRISVDERVPLTTSTYATLSYQGVTGLAFIALDDKGESQEALAPDNRNPPRIALRPSLLAQWQDRGEALIGRVDETVRRVNAMAGEDNQRRIAEALDHIARAAAGANQLTKSLDQTIKSGLTPALQALPPLVERTKDTMASVRGAAGDVSRVANNLNATATRLNAQDGLLDRLGEGTRSLAQTMESFNSATLPRLNRVADDTSQAVRRLARAADGINDNPQSLLFGGGGAAGPGEPGFVAPAAARP
jgi:phospholipid/cholesterol/gamma-HCH transport system substrate-binding protein